MGNTDSVQTHAKSEEFPYGNEFQIILIALAFREPKFIDLYEHILQPQFFDREEFRHIIRIVTQYFSRYGRTPDSHLAYGVVRSYCMDKKFPESVVQLLENVLDKIFKADLESADFVKEESIRFAQAQLMKETLLEGVKKIDDPSNYPELLKKFERVLEVAAPRDYGMKFNDIALDLPAQLREHSIFSLSRRVRTGIKSFDEHTFGGSAPKKLGVVMAPSGSGKSHLLVQFGATAIRNGQPVFHYTFGDMDMYEVFLRYASNFSGIPSDDIMHGTGRDYHTTMIGWLQENKQDLLVSTHPADTMTTAALRSHISMQISRTGIHPALIIIDYADNLAFNMQKKYGGFEHSMQLGEVYQQLIKLAHQFDCAIWTGSQVARDHWKDEVIDRDGIAASAKKIDHADYIITINRTEEERNFGTARLYEAKIRFGKDKHTIPVSFNTSTSRVEELDAPPTFLKKKEDAGRGIAGGKKQIKVDTSEEIEATDPNMERRLKILKKLNVDPST